MTEKILSNPDKVLYPKDRITKEEIYEYYASVAPLMLPLIKDRPVALERYPDGIDQQIFFQKNVPQYFPKWIERVSIKKKDAQSMEMVLCNKKETLLYLANLGCITPHIWLSTKKSLNKPDRMIFDIDPSVKDNAFTLQCVFDLKQILDKHKLPSFVMTTGSKGYHVIVPIKNLYSFDKVREFAKEIAKALCEKESRYTINPRKEARKGKIFIDYLRNGYGQLAVAPYSLRAKEKAPIAMPISWTEIHKYKPDSFTLKNWKKHPCPWKGVDHVADLKL